MANTLTHDAIDQLGSAISDAARGMGPFAGETDIVSISVRTTGDEIFDDDGYRGFEVVCTYAPRTPPAQVFSVGGDGQIQDETA